MNKRILRNKKGFTLIEIIATVALMAIIVGIAVPSIYLSTERKHKNTAVYDTQQLYRNAVSCISDLAALYQRPEKATFNSTADTPPRDGGWYVEYSRELVQRLYATNVALDIKVVYYDPNDNTNNGLVQPPNTNYAERATLVAAGNKNPYIVVQVVRIDYTTEEGNFYDNYLIVSYHNEKNQFTVTAPEDGGTATASISSAPTKCYKSNKDEDIYYTYKIRKA